MVASPPKIKLLQQLDARKPSPLTWEQQDKLFGELPDHLAKMVLFKVNTGCREQEVCSLRWEWEEYLPELGASIFVIPAHAVKNRMPRVVVLNSVARYIIEQVRGLHPEYVFTYKGNRVLTMNNSGWQKARKRVGLT